MNLWRVITHRIGIILFVLILALAAAPIKTAAAPNVSAYDVISAVNALRASDGLAPYQIDASLMNYSLQHSTYQASIHTSTHTHTDGSLPWDHGIQENIAAGMPGYITVDFIVYTIWSDAIHMKTMVGYTSGFVGAGVASDSDTVYITLDVRPGNSVSAVPLQLTPGTGNPMISSTPIPLVPLATVTPRPDGSIFHIVGYGQTLWAIALAYGIKIDQIRAWNNLPAGSTDIYAGERLLVHLAGSVTPPLVTPTITPSMTLSMTPSTPSAATPSATLSSLTATLPPATMTATVTLSPPTMTATSIATARPTLSPTVMPTVQPAGSTGIDLRRITGIVLVVVCAVGLLALFLPHFWEKKKP